ncbi:hypothetical protein ACWD1Z_34505 [Streptomyces sp. NPDC002784]
MIIAVSIIGRETDIQMPIPTPPTRPAAAPHRAWTGMAAILGGTFTAVVMVEVLSHMLMSRPEPTL